MDINLLTHSSCQAACGEAWVVTGSRDWGVAGRPWPTLWACTRGWGGASPDR